MEVYVDDIQRSIEVNHEKIKALINIQVPKTLKDIQSLTGSVAALIRFISRATNWCSPFFKAVKGNKRHITWTAKCSLAFKYPKNYMSRAPLLSKPIPDEILSINLCVSQIVISSAII
ncbi:hypothetical protein L3X38_027244 [Prunus dulcis]|uniref:Uncharacterized protein n=1 Tax=Prunus dulcis TaxID=3755 RepID=A0AAD4Z0Z7_PRUDU|nr:hypothetical protein L3X38_027244 [Prunus dulcis]